MFLFKFYTSLTSKSISFIIEEMDILQKADKVLQIIYINYNLVVCTYHIYAMNKNCDG